MADEKNTTAPVSTTTATAQAAASSPTTSDAKRVRISFPVRAVEKSEKSSKKEKEPEREESQTSESAAAPAEASTGLSDEEDSDLEADDGDADSACGSDSSDTTSVTSSIFKGMIENGRRYQTKREGDYYGPADEKQFLSLNAGHVVNMILDSNQKNRLFYSPIPDTTQNILDIGTGSGIWCRDVADLYPSALVQGVDLSPPTDTWVPPNCIFEVDDVLKPWEFKQSGNFELVHMRDMLGSFTNEQWRLLYKQAYNNLAPGGWIEQIESSLVLHSDDGSLSPNSILGSWGDMFYPLFEKMGKPMDTIHHFKGRIEAAGFINVHEKMYKCPLGEWPKNPVMKEAGSFCKTQVLEGMEGYIMFALTRFGEPTPWTPEEVHVFVAKVRQEINDPRLHAYYPKRRVWAQKPFEKEPKTESRDEVKKLA